MAPLSVPLLELCYTEKISDLHIAVFRGSPDVVNSGFVFFPTEVFNKIIPFYRLHADRGHWDDFCIFSGEGDLEGINSEPRSKQASETPFIWQDKAF